MDSPIQLSAEASPGLGLRRREGLAGHSGPPPPPRSQEGHGAQGCHWSSPRRVRKAPEEEGQLGVGE